MHFGRKRNNPTIITNSLNYKLNSSQRILDVYSTNISNDGEILSLPLFSLVYRMKQLEKEEEHHEDTRIIQPSSVS